MMINRNHVPQAPQAHVVTLTPEMAADLLARNPRNRKVSKANYSIVRRAIENGEWMLNGEAIKIDTNGVILDGQHRCHAVVDSGISIQTFIIEGLPGDTQETMDTGKARNLGDVLAIRQEANASTLASVVRALTLRESVGLKASIGRQGTVTIKECTDFLEANPWCRDILGTCKRVARNTPLAAPTVAALWVTFQELDPEDCDFFFDRLVTGEDMGEGDPIFVLRRQFNALSKERGERNKVYIAAITIKAWNKFRAGEQAGMFKFRPGGAKPEAFPEPI